MPPDTITTNEQIAKIFHSHSLVYANSPKRIAVGFTNEVHSVGDYILKVYVRPDTGEVSFTKEAGLYKNLRGTVLVPELVVADNTQSIIKQPYIIYKHIAGKPGGHIWHLLTNEQRKQIIKDGCEQLRAIAASNSNPVLADYKSWREQIETKTNSFLQIVNEQQLLDKATVSSLQNYIDTNAALLEEEKLGLQYWDFHLDNLIIDESKLVGIIDFEHVDVVSIDYILNIVRQMRDYPRLNLAEDMEQHANTAHYQDMMTWFNEFYPELFAFNNLDTRINLYELEGLLRLKPRFPNAKQIDERVQRILNVTT